MKTFLKQLLLFLGIIFSLIIIDYADSLAIKIFGCFVIVVLAIFIFLSSEFERIFKEKNEDLSDKAMDYIDTFDDLKNSEIPFNISASPINNYTASIKTKYPLTNKSVTKTNLEELDDVVLFLTEQALKHYPNSDFAIKYRKRLQD